MIYYLINKSGLLDPILERIYDRYPQCVITWGDVAKQKIKQEPFFSNRWLLNVSLEDLTKDNIPSILENRFVDVIVNINTNEELLKCHEKCSSAVDDLIDRIEKSRTKYEKNWDITKEELDKLVENFKEIKVLSTYNLKNEYIVQYIKWWLYTRNGHQYGDSSYKSIDIGEAWGKANEIQLTPWDELNLQKVANAARKSQSNLLSLLNLYGDKIMKEDFVKDLDIHFPKPKYVTIGNMPLYLFIRYSKKRREIMNIVYDNRFNVGRLKKSFYEFIDTFEKVHYDFRTGKLSVKNKDAWLQSRGIALKINSKFKLESWFKIVNTYSLERMLVIKEELNKEDSEVYFYIVNLIRRLLC